MIIADTAVKDSHHRIYASGVNLPGAGGIHIMVGGIGEPILVPGVGLPGKIVIIGNQVIDRMHRYRLGALNIGVGGISADYLFQRLRASIGDDAVSGQVGIS